MFLSLIVGQETPPYVWETLKTRFAKYTIERKFILIGQIQLLHRDNCHSVDDYVCHFKILRDELGAISRNLLEERKAFWLLNGLGMDYSMFTTMLSGRVF